MAFWGVEVKPGKPVIHSCEKARGRLRISQATLGISDATKKSIVQCNVGKKSPVLLCALLPNQTESCHLDLEFEEADDVVFSVIGPRSVYLTGYYIRQSQQSGPQSDSESYGVDIQDSQTEESSYRSDDDDYEDSFIDDDEVQNFSPSPVSRSKVKVEDETASESDRPNNGKGQRRRFKKNRQVVESDDASSNDSEDDDGYLLSIFKSKKAEKASSTGIGANIVNQNVPTNNGKDQVHSFGREKPKKKRKERAEQEKISEVENDEGYNVHREDKRNGVEASKNLDIEAHQLVAPPELDSEKCRKSKRRRKQLQSEGAFTEEIDVKSEIVAKDDNLEQSLLHTVSKKDVKAANGDQEQHIDNDISIKSGLLDTASQAEKKIKKKTTKKKKKKDQGNGESEMGLPDTAHDQETEPVKSENHINAEPARNRTLSNGLIIEEVANGPPDGKLASRGKKVKIFYTAILKENGHVFDSNVGKRPHKFRLGNEEIIDGWNLGIEGMHVGDKRRLIVPPSMGFGDHGVGENVPPDSWLVYDVELAGVYK
ncbi:peptidyl-prolyl cis-trans isomerase FKBP43-like [Salvia miltiorrhiza]|uniref:peptidyl-prolyl cis-trans isomerase FKBP43-like n=1 Tax=Salvia miltiorrhiza TaxID=226208 RepID=UPI0025AD2B55|nr:peptidyl-prolyl cis-trans isomerase FKBP43-like [Salvia miltiorrhiza]